MESIFLFVTTLGVVSFWAIIALLFLFTVVSLGVFKGIHAGSVLFFMFAALLFMRFDPPWYITLSAIVGWFVFGLFYARGRWKLQITKLKNRVIEAWNEFPGKKAEFLKDRQHRLELYEKELTKTKTDTSLSVEKKNARLLYLEDQWIKSEPRLCEEEEGFRVDLENCELDNLRFVQWQEDDDLSSVLKKFRPQFSKYRRTIAAWAFVWPLYLIKDFTIDLVRNALELLHGNFQRAADKAFS